MSDDYHQGKLFDDVPDVPPRKRRRRAQAPQKPPPQPPSPPAPLWRMRLQRAARLGRPALVGVRWVVKHAGEIKGALWIGGIVAAAVLVWLGVQHWQIEVGDYRVKIERRQKEPQAAPIATKGWEAEVKEGQ